MTRNSKSESCVYRRQKNDHRDLDMKAYSNLFDKLAVTKGLVLRGERIVVS